MRRWKPILAGAFFGVGVVARAVTLVPLHLPPARATTLAVFPHPLWFLVGTVGGALAGLLLSRRSDDKIFYPLFFSSLALLPLLPGVTAWVPATMLLSGPVLDLLLAGSLVLTALRFLDSRGFSPAPTARQVALAAFVVYLGMGYRLARQVGLSGDEPHYLIITQSILKDGDLRVDDNYARGDWEELYAGKILPHIAQPGRGGALYSIHGVGLPLLFLPGLWLLGLNGVLLTEAALGAIAVHETFRAAELVTGRRQAALVSALGFGLTAPALPLATLAYPELPAAAVAAAALRRFLTPADGLRASTAVAWGILVGLLPFFHMKFLALSLVLGLALTTRFLERRAPFLIGLLGALAALGLFFTILFGSPNPLVAYGRQRVFPELIPRGLAGLLFDQEFGLLLVSPFYVVGLASVGWLLVRGKPEGFVAVAVFLAVALPGAAHPLWHGGTSPPARFLFPALPLLMALTRAAGFPFMARGPTPAPGGLRAVRSVLVASVLLGLALVLAPGQPLYLNQRDGTGRLWEALGTSWDLTRYLPSFVRDGALSPADATARFQVRALRLLPDAPEKRLFLLPEWRHASKREILAEVRLPLEPLREEEKPGPWESGPFWIPAGEYRLSGDAPSEIEICNGESCFARGAFFQCRLGLSRFHVRTLRSWRGAPRPMGSGLSGPVALYLEASEIYEGQRPRAERSLAIGGDVRLHVLDENTFYEPNGLWVRAGMRTELMVESDVAVRIEWSIANGAAENWVDFTHPADKFRFKLAAGEARTILVTAPPGLQSISIASSAGFTPGGDDRRPLGVFVRASRL